MNKKSGMTRNTKIFGIASFLNEISSEMIFPLLPFFLTNILLAPVIVIGIIEGIGEATASITGFFSGIYTDKTGKRKQVIIGGYALSGMLKGLLAFVQSWQPVVGIRFLERFGKGMRESPRDAIIGLGEKKENLGQAYGYRKMMDGIGAIIGPLLASILLIYLIGQGIEEAYRTIFLIAVVPAALSVLVLVLIKEMKTEQNKESTKEMVKHVFKVESFKMLLVAAFVFSLGQFSVAFLLLKSNQYMDLIFVPIVYLAYNVIYTLFCMPAGRFANTLGARNMIMLGYLFFLISIIGFAFFPSSGAIFLMFGIMGLFMAVIETAPKVYIIHHMDNKLYASSMGTYGAITGLALLPANLIAGLLWGVEVFGTNASFLFSIVTTLIALALFYFKVRNHDVVTVKN